MKYYLIVTGLLFDEGFQCSHFPNQFLKKGKEKEKELNISINTWINRMLLDKSWSSLHRPSSLI